MRSSGPLSCARWSKSRAGSAQSSCRQTRSSPRRATPLFACLNLSRRFRAFIGRGGVVPPPTIRRSALTTRDRDAVIGQMAPQPKVASGRGASPLDRFLGLPSMACPRRWGRSAMMVSPRDLRHPRGARRSLCLPRRRSATDASTSARPATTEPSPTGPSATASRVFSCGRTASSPPGSIRTPTSTSFALRRRPGAAGRASRLELSILQEIVHVSFDSMLEHRTRKHRTAAQPRARREGGRAALRPFRTPRPRTAAGLSVDFGLSSARKATTNSSCAAPVRRRTSIASRRGERRALHRARTCPFPRPTI